MFRSEAVCYQDFLVLETYTNYKQGLVAFLSSMWDKPLYKLPSIGTTGKQKWEDSFSSIWLVQMSFSAQSNICGSPTETKKIWTRPSSSQFKGDNQNLYCFLCVSVCLHVYMDTCVAQPRQITPFIFSKLRATH